MSFQIDPGSVLGCRVNAHRGAWNGAICSFPAVWNCGAPQEFRQDYCESGDPRCFHVHLFDEKDPHIVVEENGASWILQDDPSALDDQILLQWGVPFHEPRGIREGIRAPANVFGLYRIRGAEARRSGYHTRWLIRPYPDGWAHFQPLQLAAPRFVELRGPYFKSVPRHAFERLLAEASASLEEQGASARSISAGDRERLRQVIEHAPRWLDRAAEIARKKFAGAASDGATQPRVSPSFSSAPANKPFKDLAQQLLPGTIVAPQAKVPSVAEPAEAAIGAVEPARAAWISRQYGEETLQALRLGSLTKPLLILRGLPGVGKSTLAMNLIDDPERERTLIVAVSSTWRGREDLLGWISPISGEFEPTAFADFLRKAELAWRFGDRRLRLVVFEEFNLSQPEYWLSDVLVRSQHEGERDRTLDLGGLRVRGWDSPQRGVMLSPALRFVATINSDHTSRPLSPRVLDRSALVELTLEPERALALRNITLPTDLVEAVSELDHLCRAKSASFSLRTARSLEAGLAQKAVLGLDEVGVLDLILLQEMLSKVRMFAADPADRAKLEEFVGWSKGPGKKLALCGREIDNWRERLAENLDVQPA